MTNWSIWNCQILTLIRIAIRILTVVLLQCKWQVDATVVVVVAVTVKVQNVFMYGFILKPIHKIN